MKILGDMRAHQTEQIRDVFGDHIVTENREARAQREPENAVVTRHASRLP